MIFANDFNTLTQEEIRLLDDYFNGYDYESSSYSLIANYIWRNTHKISWEVIGDYLCIAGLGTLQTEGTDETYFMSFPLTRTGHYEKESLRETILTAQTRFAAAGKPLEMSLIPGHLLPVLQAAFGEELLTMHDREDDDYIYLKEDLITLSGRKLHQKKNHLNYFKRTYDYTYEEITEENRAEVLAFLERINEEKLQELPEEWRHILAQETEAIENLLTLLSTGRLLTGLIRIHGQVEAATIGEFARTNDKKTVLVHVEKAANAYRGLYQAINNEFCIHLPEETIYVNREEDMGMENLRQTKLSYKPNKLAEKYSAWFAPSAQEIAPSPVK